MMKITFYSYRVEGYFFLRKDFVDDNVTHYIIIFKVQFLLIYISEM